MGLAERVGRYYEGELIAVLGFPGGWIWRERHVLVERGDARGRVIRMVKSARLSDSVTLWEMEMCI